MKEEKSYRKKRKRLWALSIISLIIILIGVQFGAKVVSYIRVDNVYKRAEELISQEKFSEAKEVGASSYPN